jgi:inositol-phosphate transport system substrate-binding protein
LRTMKRVALLVLLAAAALLLAFSFSAAAQEVITIRAWTVGPDTPAFYRAENLITAAERLNHILEVVGADIRVEVDADFWTDEWDSFRRRVILASEEGDPDVVPDILVSSHLDIPVWSSSGWLAPLDDYVQTYWESTYQDFFPHLWESVSFEGKIWGVPQDIEVRMVFYRKDHLRALGWTEDEINDLARKVEEKEFLLADLQALAKEMQAAGLVDYPIVHRPTSGPDFFQFVVAYGGDYYDPETNKLVIDKAALEATLQFFADNVKDGLTPSGMTTWPWPAVHRAIAEEGTAGMQITGGMWFWAEWQRDFGIPEEDLWENLTWSLIPAGSEKGRPNQLGHPLAYMVTSPSHHKDLAFLLITLASEVDLNTRHSLEAAKLAIRRSQTAFPRFLESEYLAEAAKLVPHQIFTAAHPAAGRYATVLHEAIGGVETGALTPTQAVDLVIQRMTQAAGDDLIIR